jgi:hypothetical protein
MLSDERTGLSFTIAAGPLQRSHSRVLVPRDSCPHFTVSDSKLPQPGGPGPRMYIHQEQAGPVIGYSQELGSHFRRLLRLAGENMSAIIACFLTSGEATCPQSCSTDSVLIVQLMCLLNVRRAIFCTLASFSFF